MISCYGGASEAVSARIGSAWKKFRKLSEAGVYLWSNRGRFISVVLEQFCCSVAKRGSLLFRMIRDCLVWSVIWSGWCVGWDWLIGCRLMFFVIGWILLWRLRIWSFNTICGGMVMSCMETPILKYMRLWKLKWLGKGRRIDQGNRRKNA